MIVKFFGSAGGGSAKASMDYLRGKQQDREGALVLKGDPDLSQSIAESLEFKNNYTVGCLSFEERDLPMKEKREIMERFEKAMFSGLKEDQYNISWIEHTDKGRLELNFYIPNVEMSTKKRLQPYYDKADRPLVDNLKKVINHEYGLTNPDAPEKKQLLKMDLKTPRSVKELKEGVNDLILNRVAKGEIKSQEQLIDLFDKAGLEVTRKTKRSISIKNPDGGRNIRFDGELYGKEFYEKTRTIEELREYARGEQKGESADHQFDSERDYRRAQEKLEREIRWRAERNNALYPQLEDHGSGLDNYHDSHFIGLGVDRVASENRKRESIEIDGSDSSLRRIKAIYQSRQDTDLNEQGRKNDLHHIEEQESERLQKRALHSDYQPRGLRGFINELSQRTKDTLQRVRGRASGIAERTREIAKYMLGTDDRKQEITGKQRSIRDFNESVQSFNREINGINEHAKSRELEIQRTDRSIAQVERQIRKEINNEQDRGFSLSR